MSGFAKTMNLPLDGMNFPQQGAMPYLAASFPGVQVIFKVGRC